MPQMSPLNWLMIYLFLMLILLLINIILNYLYMNCKFYLVKYKTLNLNKNWYNFKW